MLNKQTIIAFLAGAAFMFFLPRFLPGPKSQGS